MLRYRVAPDATVPEAAFSRETYEENPTGYTGQPQPKRSKVMISSDRRCIQIMFMVGAILPVLHLIVWVVGRQRYVEILVLEGLSMRASGQQLLMTKYRRR
ncbi:hypothetical protein H9L39_11115 [Fusarium oxysporum f. sp. albedinis]|nr:hypothetical protein H9L39_11115 [Fusarium oxysporum f. sp. albedinis]